MSDLFSVKGKVAIVTGGRRGIGRAIVMALHDAGAKVHVIAKSDDRGDLPTDIAYWTLDLSIRAQRNGVIDYITVGYPFDILVNNAGCQHLAPALDYHMADWDYDMEVMVTAAFDLSRQAAKYMIKQGGGKIVNISSIVGVTGVRNAVGYSAAKHAQLALTRSLSNEWAGYGICVNAILPGFTETDMASSLLDDKKHTAEIVGRIPKGRFAKPEDMVGTALWLCSSASDYVTGALIPVDGGWLAR